MNMGRGSQLRVLQVVHNFLPFAYGGTEAYTYNLCKQLAKSHKVFIMCGGGAHFLKRPVVVDEIYDGLQVQRVYLRASPELQGSFKNKDAEGVFERVLDKTRPDVVHFQHLLGLSSGFISIAKYSGVPTVLHLHDYWYLCPNIQLLYANTDICEGPTDPSRCAGCLQAGGLTLSRSNVTLKDLAKLCLPRSLTYVIARHKRFAALRGAMGKLSLRKLSCSVGARSIDVDDLRLREEQIRRDLHQADVILSDSDFVRDKYIDWGLSPGKVRTLYYGHDHTSARVTRKPCTDGIVFGYLGGLSSHKGVDVLIRAFCQLNDTRAHLSIHGWGDGAFIRGLRLLAQGARVNFAGRYEREELPLILSNIDILVVPSMWAEAYGIVIEEAFIAKVPVIASRVGGIPERVIHGANGLLFEPGNVRELAEQMNRILKEPSLLKRLGHGIGTIKSISENAREIEEIYRSLTSTIPCTHSK